MAATMTQKQIAQTLDRAAARADMIGAYPATGKQCWFLAKLILEKDDGSFYDELSSFNCVLTSKNASAIISDLLN